MIYRNTERTLRGFGCVAFLILPLLCPGARASVNIGPDATQNMNCARGVCAPTAKKAALNVTDLAKRLARSNVKVTSGSGAVTIEITAPFSWTSAHRLTLEADYNVSIKAPVTVAGPGGLTVVTNGGGTDGDLLFFSGGKIDFWDLTSSLIIGRKKYALVNGIKQLADEIGSNRSGSYAFAKDYDALPDGTYASSPIPTEFQGVFEGLGHTVANLAVNDPLSMCVGFFRSIASSGVVRDTRLTGATIFPGHHRYAREGVLAGCNEGTIANSDSGGSVKGWWVGGLVGYNDGLVRASSSNAAVEGKRAGGLVGISDGVISDSHASGPVSGQFVGRRAGIDIYAGGLASMASAVVQSYATGPVSVHGTHLLNGHYSAGGGLVGFLTGPVTDSYATGSVSGERSTVIGGLIGQNHGASAQNSYAAGTITGAADEDFAQGGAVGLVESESGFADVYWDLETSGQTQGCGKGDCSAIAGLTDAQLKSSLPAGFDPAVWGQNAAINNGYPYLLANPPPQ